MGKILFYSTNHESPEVDLKGALLQGQAPDRGLYMPREYPAINPETFESFSSMEYPDIAFEVLKDYTRDVVKEEVLRQLCEDAYNYEVPVEKVYGRTHVMRLDRGPTASFKDFAARMMARLIGRFVREEGRELVILTATSGDTGSAVASAFHGVEGIRVLVLFPVDEVSDRQRKQMTTLGDNVRTIALDGKFDDCQAMVKRAFADEGLQKINLSSANSINIGRLLPQSVYYFYAASRVVSLGEPLVMVVPSGNFGNMMGCVFAHQRGLKLKRLVVPVNENDEYPVFWRTMIYQKIEPSKKCISNAMNVGHPSNLARLVDVYGGRLDEKGVVHKEPDFERMRKDIFTSSISDEETRETIKKAWEEHHLLLEPHGAVGWRGYLDYLEAEKDTETPAVVVETAHPAKFPEEIQAILNLNPEAPSTLSALDEMKEDYDHMNVDYAEFKEYLKKNYS